MYTQNYYSLVHWPMLRCLLLALGTQAYTGSSPVTTDAASCFDASRLSMNIPYFFDFAAHFVWLLFEGRVYCFESPETYPRQLDKVPTSEMVQVTRCCQ